MASTEIPTTVIDSEREEGEIVDDLDELSDISSEEEYLLRQRLQVLESYNVFLERKEAKKNNIRPGLKLHSNELSHISTTNFGHDYSSPIRSKKSTKPIQSTQHKVKRKKEPLFDHVIPKHNVRKKPRTQKKIEVINGSESSEESDYEYRNKRRKLADAVVIKKNKTDTSLKARLMEMLCNAKNKPKKSRVETKPKDKKRRPSLHSKKDIVELKTNDKDVDTVKSNKCLQVPTDLIDISTDDEVQADLNVNSDKSLDIKHTLENNDVVDSSTNHIQTKSLSDSDDDLETLREHALKSKHAKVQETEVNHNDLDDEDSDTAELRLICLRSTLLKKAIEWKQKQKLRKRLSQSISLHDEIIGEDFDISPKYDTGNNTDIESVDMDIGSDGADQKDDDHACNNITLNNEILPKSKTSIQNSHDAPNEDDIEDEDLLRAKLLTSLTKNLAVSVNSAQNGTSKVVSDISNKQSPIDVIKPKENKSHVDKRFVINTADSDSEEEHEATKSLKQMHIKLFEQTDFQQKLDQFLKSTRMEVEKNKLPDVLQQPVIPITKTPEKFVPKAVNHLPKSEQQEYKSLVKRMAELEKIKQARMMNVKENPPPIVKETLKPRNVTLDKTQQAPLINLEEQIAASRKKIAQESSVVLQLKEEENKLIQRRKIVATELHNLSTAITLNKKKQKITQIKLSKMRSQHQTLLKRSKTVTHTTNTQQIKVNPAKLQKENEPVNINNMAALKSLRVSVNNDFKEQKMEPKPELSDNTLSVKIDLVNNKKTVTVPTQNQTVETNLQESVSVKKRIPQVSEAQPVPDHDNADNSSNSDLLKVDYHSPLDAFTSRGWHEDPNAVLCPFDVGGVCKDTNCEYLHSKNPH